MHKSTKKPFKHLSEHALHLFRANQASQRCSVRYGCANRLEPRARSTYMDTPLMPSGHFMVASIGKRLHPYIRIFSGTCATTP